MKKGFTLVEMLVVIGIIAILVAASIGGYSSMTKTADRARAQELVSNVATALTALFQNEGVWPKRLVANGGGTDGRLDENAAYALVSNGRTYFSLTTKNGKLAGNDRFGILTPWAQAAVKSQGTRATETTKVGGGGTVQDHVLHYALDLDGDGRVEGASVGGQSVSVRATAIVWSCGKNGVVEAYSAGGKTDNVYSWTPGQTRDVE